MTHPTEVTESLEAIRAALVAGPTPGPWLEKGRVNPSREAIRIESHHPADEHHLYQVCDVLDANGYPRNQANLQFIAACNPEAITALLAEDAAKDERIAQLEADARRMLELEDRLTQIDEWAKAYPLDVFPEPDLKRAHEVLEAAGISLGAISAYAMRHVLSGVQKIAALAATDKGGGDV